MASILIIDDDAMAAEVYVSLMEGFGHEAAFATSCNDALQHLQSARPDLIVLDLMMPEMNGLDFLRKLKSEEHTAPLQVVIFSALDETQWRERAASAGACDYWIKGGFDFGELQERITTCIAGCNRTPVFAEAAQMGSDTSHNRNMEAAHENC